MSFERQYLKDTLNERTWVSNPDLSTVTGKPVVPVSAPIMDGKNMVGILVLAFDVERSHMPLSKTKIGKTGSPYMDYCEGLTFAHPNPDFILKLDISKLDVGQGRYLQDERSAIRCREL